MKKINFNSILYSVLFTCFSNISCQESFLEQGAVGSLNNATLANKQGINGLLIGAYSLLDGIGAGGVEWANAVSNWVFGGVASDEAHKGAEYGDQGSIELIENYTITAENNYMNSKWSALYAGIQRANDVLRMMKQLPAGALTESESQQMTAEARFLRGVYHFEAVKMWRNVPYIDESVSFQNGNFNVANKNPIWVNIEDDFKFSSSTLNPIKAEVGRANSWAAKAFLIKVYMFQHKFTLAKPLLDDVLTNGVTSKGVKYQLENSYADNFNPATKNGSESVFAVQMSVKDGSNGFNGNAGDALNFPGGGPATCCGFYQPSFSFVNSFQTDPTSGLPLQGTYNKTMVKNDHGLLSTQNFIPYSGTLDPRLDHTVGRRGIPYLDWGNHPGQSWIRAQAAGGPYSPKKNVYYKSAQASTSETYNGWAVNQSTANNYVMIRFADIILWAAEVEVEIGTLAEAERLVNIVRSRASNQGSWVKKYIDGDAAKGNSQEPAANYKIGLYNGQFSSLGKTFAREAVRMERMLELGMEGHRFFDLQRYDNGTGYMADVLNNYIQYETSIPGYSYQILKGAKFTKGRNEIYPLPLRQIDLSEKGGEFLLKQNPGY